MKAAQGRSSSLTAQVAPVIVGQVFLHAAMAGSRMAAPLVALGQGHGKLLAGALVALFALTQIFLSLPAGRFADRHGLRRPLAWCALGSSLGIGLAALWPQVGILWLTALLCGGAVGGATIAMQRHVGRAAMSPLELKRAYSLLSIAPAAGNLVGPVTAGVLIDLAGFRAAFAVLATMPVLAWLISRQAREYTEEPPPSPGVASKAWDLLAAPEMRRLMFMNTLMTSSWDFHSFMVPLLGHERGVPASAIGTVLGAFAIAAASVRLTIPWIIHRLREWVMITGAVALAGVVLIAYPFTSSLLAMCLCSALLGMALGSVQPMALSMLHHLTPAHRQGEALGIRLIFVNASTLSMPLLLGTVGGLAGVSGVFWIMGGLVTLGSHVGVRLRHVAAP